MGNLFTVACLLSFICSGSALGTNTPEKGTSPDELQAQLDEAEINFKAGKIDTAITQATSLLNVKDSSFLKSDHASRNAKADLAVFQLKAGHPDQTALLIRQLLISLQLELPMSEQFSQNSAQIFAESPKQLKVFFDSVIRRLDDQSDTKQIIYSIIDNTVPKDYERQLNEYSNRLQKALAQLQELKPFSDREELKYGDPLTPLNTNPENKSDPNLRETSLERLGISFNQLAKDAQQMPVGDARAALGLSKLALASNSAEHYALGEKFARQSIQHFEAIANDLPQINQAKITLAYALMKQAKIGD